MYIMNSLFFQIWWMINNIGLEQVDYHATWTSPIQNSEFIKKENDSQTITNTFTNNGTWDLPTHELQVSSIDTHWKQHKFPHTQQLYRSKRLCLMPYPNEKVKIHVIHMKKLINILAIHMEKSINFLQFMWEKLSKFLQFILSNYVYIQCIS